MVLAAVLAIAIVVSASIGSLWLGVASIRREATLLPAPGAGPAPAGVEGSLNLMLIGVDGTSPHDPAQVLLLMHVDADRQRVHVVSVPRELLVTLPDGAREPIGSAYGRVGVGPAGVVGALQDVLGVRVDHVAVTRLVAMARLIDLLDGITVDNPVASVSEGHSFQRGPITLNGERALAFVRQGDGEPGDLDRAESQRLVLQGIVERLLTSKSLLNLGMVKAVLNQLSDQIVVDSGLDAWAMVRLFIDLRMTSSERGLRTIKLPTAGGGTTPDGQRYLEPDTDRVRGLGEALNKDRLDAWVR